MPAVLYVAKAIILPVVLAVVLKLLLNPGLRFLERWSVPRVLADLLLILSVTAFIVGLVAALTGPAGDWFAKLPSAIPRMQKRLEFLREPVEIFRRFLHAVRRCQRCARPEKGPLRLEGPEAHRHVARRVPVRR